MRPSQVLVLSLALIPSTGPTFADAFDTPLAKGEPVLGQVQEECDNSFILDGVNKLCSLLQGEDCTPDESYCRPYQRQIFTGTNLGKKTPIGTWNGMGGSGELIADTMMCSMRELSPQIRGPIRSSAEIDLGIGTLRATQEVGFKSFQRINPVVEGYRKIILDLPVVGKADAVTQNIRLTRTKYSYVGAKPRIGDREADSTFALDATTDRKWKKITITPGAFPVSTPIGTFTVQPVFKYNTDTGVAAAPFGSGQSDLPNFLGTQFSVRYTDIYGAAAGMQHSAKDVVYQTIEQNRTGWLSQLGFGTRAALPGGSVWQAPGAGVILRPELDFTQARSTAEAVPSVHAEASAVVKYPEDPREILPDWVMDLSFFLSALEAYVTVAPTVEAGAGGQVLIGASEGSNHTPWMEFQFQSARWSASTLAAALNVAASFNIKVGLRLLVKANFPWPVGEKTLVDVDKTIPLPITGNKVSGETHVAGGWSTGRESPESLDYLRTFFNEYKDPVSAGAFIQQCYAPNNQPAAVTPPATEPEPGNPQDLYADTLWPCNICLYTEGVKHDGSNDPAWNNQNVDVPAQGAYLTPSVETPDWNCNSVAKSGCMNMCTFNPATSELHIARTPRQIASGLPFGHKDRGHYEGCYLETAIALPRQPN